MSALELQVTDTQLVSKNKTVTCALLDSTAHLEHMKRFLVDQEPWASTKVLKINGIADHANLILTTTCGEQVDAKDVVPLHSLNLIQRLIFSQVFL
jgi:hypothetical protein